MCDLIAWRPAPAVFAQRNRALAYLSVGERDRSAYHLNEAFRLMEETRKEFPKDPAIAAGLGLILLLKDLPREAARAFELALALRPGHPPYHQNLAAAWTAAGESSKAIHALEASLVPDVGSLVVRRAVVDFEGHALSHPPAPELTARPRR